MRSICATRIVKFLDLICNFSTPHVPIVLIILELLLSGESLLILEPLFLTLRSLQYLVICFEATDRAYIVNSDLIKFIFRVLAQNRISCVCSDSLPRNYSDLVTRVRSCCRFSDSANITSSLSACLSSRLGWSTGQLLIATHNVANADGRRSIHDLLDIR